MSIENNFVLDHGNPAAIERFADEARTMGYTATKHVAELRVTAPARAYDADTGRVGIVWDVDAAARYAAKANELAANVSARRRE